MMSDFNIPNEHGYALVKWLPTSDFFTVVKITRVMKRFVDVVSNNGTEARFPKRRLWKFPTAEAAIVERESLEQDVREYLQRQRSCEASA